jgi:hypothetical protein
MLYRDVAVLGLVVKWREAAVDREAVEEWEETEE